MSTDPVTRPAKVVYQNTHIVGGSDSLFYTPVKIGGKVTLDAMLDSGSMTCTISTSALRSLFAAGAVSETEGFFTDVTLVGVGGSIKEL